MTPPTPELLDEARRELRALLDDLRRDAVRAAPDHHAGAVCRLCSFLGLTVRDALREGRACEGAARHLAGVLAARGVRCTPVVVYQGTEVYALPQQTMRAAGWVRTAEVRRVLRDVEEDLSGPPSSVHPAFFVRRAAETHFRMPEDA
jgi:hypothetical protein